jgi:transcriptional regulator with XRE-family HTH domain
MVASAKRFVYADVALLNQSLPIEIRSRPGMQQELREHIRSESDRLPKPVDSHVGSRIRLRRTLLGMSQERLGEALGLTFQQVQKYERGLNRVGASRLFDLSRALDVPISFFFDGMPDGLMGEHMLSPARARPLESDPTGSGEAADRRETLELVRAYYRIIDPTLRKRLFDLLKSMAPSES